MKVILDTRDKIAKERQDEMNKLEQLAQDKKDEYEREATLGDEYQETQEIIEQL